MDEREAWKLFESTGSVDAYLLYAENKKDSGYDAQGQRDPAADRSNRS
jgi:hypothetical protein